MSRVDILVRIVMKNDNEVKNTFLEVLHYYYYLWDRTGGVTPDKLFIGLPPSVLTSICQCMYGRMIRKAFGDDGIKDKDIQGFYRLLSTYITPSLYLKNSIICR